MSPLPCSPVSNSTASEQSAQPSEVDSDDSLITPRPGPSDPAQRSATNLSKPSVPTFESQPDGQVRSPFTYNGSRNSSGNTSPTRERQKSVTFSSQTSLPRPEKQGSYKMSQARNKIVDEYESSADESSGILAKQRGPVKTNGYGAVGSATDGPNEEVRGYEAGAEEPEHLRQRRPASVRSKDSLQNRGQPQIVTADATSPDVSTEHQGWFKALVEKYGSVELENKGSVARDHLALERTFLAWLRTSLSFASIGVAVTQLFRLNTSIQKQHPSFAETPVTFLDVATFSPNSRLRSVGKPLGATFLGISILILLIGFHRYFESQHYVIRGKFPASRGSILLVSLLATLLILASLIVVIAVAPSAFET